MTPIPSGTHARTCACGQAYEVDARTLRKHRKRGTEPRCPSCLGRLKALNAARCRGARPRVRRAEPKLCDRCYGLSHRVIGGICKCGLRFAPLPGVTIADVVASHVGPGRVFPEGGV